MTSGRRRVPCFSSRSVAGHNPKFFCRCRAAVEEINKFVPLVQMLTEFQRKLWEAYQRAEERAPRGEKLLGLEAFVDALVVSPQAEWFSWARSIAEQVVDKGAHLVIRRPLFERAVFPALLAGFRTRLPGCARWLAGLFANVWRCPACREQLLPEETTEVGLLRAAVSHDPSDQQSRQRLIQKIADGLRYSVHEVPAGVLYGIDGASPEQCQELEEELDELCRLVGQEQLEQRYGQLIRTCRLHFRAYRDYLFNRDRYSSYEAFLCQYQRSVGG